MRKTILGITAFAVFLLSIASASAGLYCGEPTVTPLIAGQKIDAGTVSVWNDIDYLYVKYETTGGWCLTETHLAVKENITYIPQKNGNPIPGQFEYSNTSLPVCTKNFMYTINMSKSGFDVNDDLVIAAHAVVKTFDAYGNVTASQTGWGNGTNFPGKNWAMYFQYRVQGCYYTSNYCGESTNTTLYAGRTIDTGMVRVWNDADTLYVEYTATGNWCLDVTHLAVKENLADIPVNNAGNPEPGQFEYSTTHPTCTKEYTYEIDLGDKGFDVNDGLYVAAHASMFEYINGIKTNQQTGWGDGTRFVQKGSWATYFQYTVQDCPVIPKTLKIPSIVNMLIAYPGANSYWGVTLSGVPAGYDIWNGVWNGWCADSRVTIGQGTHNNVNAYLSTDPLLATKCPSCVNDENWAAVNYIINQNYAGATWKEIQAAIWNFTESATPDFGTVSGYNKTITQMIIDDTNANYEDFVVGTGDWMAVLLSISNQVQLLFIEVDP